MLTEPQRLLYYTSPRAPSHLEREREPGEGLGDPHMALPPDPLMGTDCRFWAVLVGTPPKT